MSQASVLSAFGEVFKKMSDTAEKYEGLAGATLDWGVNVLEEKEGSMFNLTIATFSRLCEMSEKELYEKLLIGLCDHLNKLSLSVFMKFNSNSLLFMERISYIEKIRTVSLEELYFKEKRLNNFEYPEKTVKLIHRTLQLVDPNAEACFDPVVSFVKYYKNDQYLDLPFKHIVKGMEKRSNRFPFIKLNESLLGSTNFDKFIRSCYPIARTNHLNLLNFVKMIIYGPISAYSTEVFYEVFNLHLFKALMISTADTNRLIYRIMKSNTLDTFSIFFSDEFAANDPNITQFKAYLEKQKNNYEAVQVIVNTNLKDIFEPAPGRKTNFLKFLTENKSCMEEYYEIDPQFIGEGVTVIHENILWILEESKKFDENATLSGCAALACFFLSLVPMKNFTNHLKDVSYEPLLDLLLDPRIFKDQGLISRTNFRKIICLPHVKVDFQSLEKVLRVFESYFGNSEVDLGCIAVTISQERDNLSEAEVFEIFTWIHRLFDSREMNFEPIASAYYYNATFVLRGRIAKLYRDYVAEHGLVFKSLIKIGEIFEEKIAK